MKHCGIFNKPYIGFQIVKPLCDLKAFLRNNPAAGQEDVIKWRSKSIVFFNDLNRIQGIKRAVHFQ